MNSMHEIIDGLLSGKIVGVPNHARLNLGVWLRNFLLRFGPPDIAA